MGAHGLGRLLGVQDGGGDVKARFETRAVGELGARLDANEGRGAGEAMLAGKAPIAVEPIDVMKNADGPLLDAAVAFVMIDANLDGARGGGVECGLGFGAEPRLVGFE